MDEIAQNELEEFKRELDSFHESFSGLVNKGILTAVGMNEQGEVQYRLTTKGIQIAQHLGFERDETNED
tara:strand:- start:522 stop:728 length:207 start_codon:yes stop_codon:yes gene_type:complete